MKKLLIVVLTLAMLLAANANAAIFSDVDEGDYYAEAAEYLSQTEVLDGYDDGTFGAEKTITRAEMTAVICRMIGKGEADDEKPAFSDVGKHWAKGYIATAAKEGIVNGDDEGTFRPDDKVKFEEALKMVVCAAGFGEGITVDPADWSAAYIKAAEENDLTFNLEGEKGEPATRGDVAVMVYNAVRPQETEQPSQTPETTAEPTAAPTEAPTAAPTQAAPTATPAPTMIPDSKWEGKNILFVGDALVSDKVYPQYICDMLGANAYYHCSNTATMLQQVIGNFEMEPLAASDVRDMDLIILHAGYNNTNISVGTEGTCYDDETGAAATFSGYTQYLINHIYSMLDKANNTDCKLMMVSVDVTGSSPYTFEYTTPEMADKQKLIATLDGIPFCNLYTKIGSKITKYFKYTDAWNLNYASYEMDATGKTIGTSALRYRYGEYYYQKRDGKVVYEEYEGEAPYPYINDKVHKTDAGYLLIAETIVDEILAAF